MACHATRDHLNKKFTRFSFCDLNSPTFDDNVKSVFIK